MRTTAGALLRGNIYAFVFGEPGVGKSRLALSLTEDKKGEGCAYVTSEAGEATSVASVNNRIPVELLDSGDVMEAAAAAVTSFAREKSIKVICVDNLTALCGNLVHELSDGEGEKALGFEGWQEVLAKFRNLEIACNGAVKKYQKSVIMTAWELAPVYEGSLGGETLKSEGRPFLQGKAKQWMPGQCDIIARMTSKVATEKNAEGKLRKVWKGQLTLDRSTDFLCKTRWKLPSPYPADLGQMLRDVRAQVKSVKKIPAPLGEK